jgi:hypothetical protein
MEPELEDERPAADLTCVPAFFQERPFRIDHTSCLGRAGGFSVGPVPLKAVSSPRGPQPRPNWRRAAPQVAHSDDRPFKQLHSDQSRSLRMPTSSEEYSSGADPGRDRWLLGRSGNT